MLQAIRPNTSNHTGNVSTGIGGRDNGVVKLGREISNSVKLDILDLLLIATPPEEFSYDAGIKYLYYRDGKVLGLLAYNLVPMARIPTPLLIHIIGEHAFRKTREGYNFMLSTFLDLKKDHKVICTHIPNDRMYIIKPMLKFGFVEYSEDKYGKFYYLDLEKIQ